MFDVGEVGLIAVIALLVLGPERLPGAARTVGALLRKARQSWQNVRAEVEREIAADEFKRNIAQATAAADPTAEIRAAAESISKATVPAVEPPSAVPAPAHDEQR